MERKNGDLPELTAIIAADELFLTELYASARIAEIAIASWSDEQKQAFPQM